MKNLVRIGFGLMLYMSAACACDNEPTPAQESVIASIGDDVTLVARSFVAGFGSSFLIDTLRERGSSMKSLLTDNGICRDKMTGVVTFGTAAIGMQAVDELVGNSTQKDAMQQIFQMIGITAGFAFKNYVVHLLAD